MAGLSVNQFSVGGFDKNLSYLIHHDASQEAMLVDPAGDVQSVIATAEEQHLTITGVLITHTHFDHHEQLAAVLEQYPVPVYVHERGAAQLDAEGVRPLQDCGTVSIGGVEVTVLHTPGHCGDAVCYFIPAGCAADGTPKLISGDTLFVDRVGKTNEGDVADLWQSLQWLMELPDATEVYPGHDYGAQSTSTIGREKTHNPYLTVSDFEAFKAKRL